MGRWMEKERENLPPKHTSEQQAVISLTALVIFSHHLVADILKCLVLRASHLIPVGREGEGKIRLDTMDSFPG